jgi:hypothetical protein
MRTWRSLVILLFALLAARQSASAQAQQTSSTKPPYTVEDVQVLLQGGHSAARIVTRVSSDCIAFRVDGAAAELRRAGADDAVQRTCTNTAARRPANRGGAAARMDAEGE